MRKRMGILLPVAAIIGLSSCHPRQDTQSALEEVGAQISVRVENRNRVDVNIFVVHDAMSSRLGLATASTTTFFRFPYRLLGAGRDYRLVGDVVGSRVGITTETIHAQPGDEVTWSLEDNFARSTVTVR